MVGIQDKRNAYRFLVENPEGKRPLRKVFLNRRAAARYRALASIIPARERFSWN